MEIKAGKTLSQDVFKGLRKDVTLMHIADLHIGHHRGSAYLEKIVDETNRRRPDLVLLNGDLLDSNAALSVAPRD